MQPWTGHDTCVENAGPIRVMLVDDHPMWMTTLRQVIEGLGVGVVVAECEVGRDVEAAATATEPDVVVMDVDMPLLDGVTATRRLLEADPDHRVLMLTGRTERSTIAAAVAAGASGYLVKTVGPTAVAEAISRIRTGELVFPDAASAVVREALRAPRSAAARTLTLLLTDVEDSTGHAVTAGPRWPDELVAHRRLLRRTCEPFGGTDHGGRGDECVLTFTSANDAVRAAVDCQRALARTDWSALGRPLRVRMGIHTGEPVATDEGYEGLDFHLAARIRDIGAGGTILLSAATAGVVANAAIAGTSLVEVGEVRLTGLAAPARLTRVVIDGLTTEQWLRRPAQRWTDD